MNIDWVFINDYFILSVVRLLLVVRCVNNCFVWLVSVCGDCVVNIYGIVIGVLLFVVVIDFIIFGDCVGFCFRIICVFVLFMLNDDILVCCGLFVIGYGVNVVLI